MPNASTVLVVGAGVCGLTSALELSSAGFDVEVVAAERPEETTSIAAGAVWGPYLVEPLDKVHEWSTCSLEVFKRLAAEEPSSGVHITSGIEASRTPDEPPPWAEQLPNFRACERHELPPGFLGGWSFSTPTIDMPTYLRYLEHRLSGNNVGLRIEPPFESLADVAGRASIIVNCTGSGARDFTPDDSITVIKGHLVVVENPGLTDFFSEETGDSPELLHYCPHGDTVVLGGVAEPNNWDRQPASETSEAILRRCAAIEPRLATAQVLENRTGLRPTRPQVRVEIDLNPDQLVIHNYGHGGAGVTLSWGCATTVTKLAKQLSHR